MRKMNVVILGLAVLLSGCSNLVVHKVPMDERQAHVDDHIDGFRYYLSRPYVLVLQPIPLTTTKVLVALDKLGRFTYLDGPLAGQTSSMEELKKQSMTSGVVKPVSPAELARLKQVIQEPSGTSGGIEPVAYRGGSYTQNVILADQASDGLVADQGDGQTAPPASPAPAKMATPAPAGRKSAMLNGPIQIVFLPDMDEQYAIHSKNCLSKSDFALQFRNGWELTDVSGKHDSTPVAVELIKTIDAAIETAKTLSTASLGKVLPGGGGPPEKGTSGKQQTVKNWHILTRTTVLKPGMYRLNKPWEMEEGTHPTGCGLLARLGLETFTTAELRPVTQNLPTSVTGAVITVDPENRQITIMIDRGAQTFSISETAKLTINKNPVSVKDGLDQIQKVLTGKKTSTTVTATGTTQDDHFTELQITITMKGEKKEEKGDN